MNSLLEEADAISVAEVIDEEHFEEDQTSTVASTSKIEENNNRMPPRRNERKRSYPDDNVPEQKTKIKVVGPWPRSDRRTEEQSGAIMTGVKSSHRPSPSPKKPFVNPKRTDEFIQTLYDIAKEPEEKNNALMFKDRFSKLTYQTHTQVFYELH